MSKAQAPITRIKADREQLAGLTNEELLHLIVVAFDEGAARGNNYLDVVDDAQGMANLPDVLGEAISFLTRLDDLMPGCLAPPVVRDFSREVHRYLRTLKNRTYQPFLDSLGDSDS
jgi:hypothetical protein